MSMNVSAHMASYAKPREEEKFAKLNVELTYCVHNNNDLVMKYHPEGNQYTRLKLRSYDADVDITMYMQREHLMAMLAALSEYAANLPDYVERGDRGDYREDVIKRSEDFAVKQEKEAEEIAQ